MCLPLALDGESSEGTKEGLFFTMIMLGFWCEGGHFVIMPTILGKLFGSDGGIRVFSVAFSFVGIGSLIHIFFMSVWFDKGFDLGFEGFCHLYSVFSSISLVMLLLLFKEERAFSK